MEPGMGQIKYGYQVQDLLDMAVSKNENKRPTYAII